MRDFFRSHIAVVAVIFLAAMFVGTSFAQSKCEYTYDNFGKDFLSKYCTSCHSEKVTGVKRMGAPSDFNFDSPDKIKPHTKDMVEQVVTNKSMPPTLNRPSDADRTKFGKWLECEYKK